MTDTDLAQRQKTLKLITLMDYKTMSIITQQVLSYGDCPFNFKLLDKLNHILWEVCHNAKMGIVHDKREAKEMIETITECTNRVKAHIELQILDSVKEDSL